MRKAAEARWASVSTVVVAGRITSPTVTWCTDVGAADELAGMPLPSGNASLPLIVHPRDESG
jgi:hypothetical protein